MKLDFKRLTRNHFYYKVNYLWIFLQIFFHRRAAIMDWPPRLVAACSRFEGVQRQVIASATCLSSQPGVEVAPQIPTLSPAENHSADSSDGPEMWWVRGFLDWQSSQSTFPLELETPDTKTITSCRAANSANSSCLDATCEQIVS